MRTSDWITCRRSVPPSEVAQVLAAAQLAEIQKDAKRVWSKSAQAALLESDSRLRGAVHRVLSTALFLACRVDHINPRNAVSEFVRFAIADPSGDLRGEYRRRDLADVLLPIACYGLRLLRNKSKLAQNAIESDVDHSDPEAVKLALQDRLQTIRLPAGRDPIQDAIVRSETERREEMAAWKEQGAEPCLAWVAAVCRELAEASEDGTFYLPVTLEVAEKIGIGHSTLSDCLNDLIRRGFLVVLTQPSRKAKRARRFRLGKEWIGFTHD